MRTVLMTFLVWIVFTPLRAEDYVALNEEGNKAFAEEKYKEALDYYRQAEVERPETPEIYYNQANALVQTQGFEEAIEKYQKVLNSDDFLLQARAFYNGGNSYFLQEDYQNAIQWYEKSLELNPDDMDAKYNLELARNRLREQMERQPQEQQQQQQQQQQEQQQQEQEQQKQEEQQEQEQQDQEEQEEQQQQKPEQPKPDEMSEEDALRILKALEDAEKDDQKQIKKFKGQGTYRGKDW